MGSLKDLMPFLAKQEAGEEDGSVHNIVMVMKEFGYTLDEVKSLPLPTFATLIERLNKESEKQERDMKSKSRR